MSPIPSKVLIGSKFRRLASIGPWCADPTSVAMPGTSRKWKCKSRSMAANDSAANSAAPKVNARASVVMRHKTFCCASMTWWKRASFSPTHSFRNRCARANRINARRLTMATVSANRLELLQIADAVAREKAIDRKIVLGAMEDAIAKAARSRYGSETEVRAEIDPKSGELHLSRHMLVVDTVENPATQIS